MHDHRRKCFNATTRSHTSRTLDPCRNADLAQLEQNCGKGTLLEKIASLIPSYYDTRFESKRQTITTTVSKPSAHLARILSYFHWAINVNGWTYAHVCLQIHNGKKLTWCSHDKHCGVYYNASTHEIVKQRPFALKLTLANVEHYLHGFTSSKAERTPREKRNVPQAVECAMLTTKVWKSLL